LRLMASGAASQPVSGSALRDATSRA
jgi:hypothetical protein